MRSYCSKIPYSSKKEARRAARFLSDSKWGDAGSKYSQHHCKECGSWHIYTENRKKRKNQSQHSTGGRKRWMRGRRKARSQRSS